jgi:hypothetical protein
MITVTQQEAIDKLLANNYRAITILQTVDCDGEDIDIVFTTAYVDKSDKDVPLKILKSNMDMYDFIYIIESN